MKKWPWFLLTLLIIVLDQASKYLALLFLVPYQPIELNPVFNLTLAFNSGAAFSFLSQVGGWQRWFFAGFSTIVSCVLFLWLLKTPKSNRLQLFSISLVLGGAIGNLYDRAFVGFVVDFIDLHYKHHHWPIFNIADTAICVGAILLAIDMLRKPN